MEGQGKEFLARPGSLQHLLQCDDCRTERILPPPHHRLAELRRHLHLVWRAQDCDWPLHTHVTVEETDGGYDCTVHCSVSEHGIRAVRSVRLSHEEAAHGLSRTVEEALAQDA